MNPYAWLAAANAAWLLGGLLAYATRASLVLATAIALVPAVPAVLELRRQRPGLWADRTLAATLGTWAVMAILIITPYMATEDGVSLWTSRTFAATGLALASVGMLLWNVSAFFASGGDGRTARMYGAFHAVTLAAALYMVATGDGGRQDVALRGDGYAVVDLAWAPAMAAVASVPWLMAFLRRPEPAWSDEEE